MSLYHLEIDSKTPLHHLFRSTTSKTTPPPSFEESYEYKDQKFSFTRKNKVKSDENVYNVKPLNQYNVNITHQNNLQVKPLKEQQQQQSQLKPEISEEDPEYEYEYEDDDYGVILTEEDRNVKEKITTERASVTATTPLAITTPETTTEPSKPESHTVILTDNFFLPKQNSDNDVDKANPEESEEEEIEYIEYIDDEEEEQTTSKSTQNSEKAKIERVESTLKKSTESKHDEDYTIEVEEVTERKGKSGILGEAVVSVVTSKTVVNGSIMDNQLKDREYEESPEEIENTPSTESSISSATKSNADNDYFVIASVQTSSSISGSHFVPFPDPEHQEKRPIAKPIKEVNFGSFEEISTTEKPEVQTTVVTESENISAEIDSEEELNITTEEPTTSMAPTSTSRSVPLQSTESIIDKLDRVQSELSLGILSGEYPVLMETSTSESPKTTTSKPFVVIRKFSPKTTTSKAPTTRLPFKLPITQTSVQETFSESLAPSSLASTTVQTTTVSSTTIVNESTRGDKKLSFDDAKMDEIDKFLPPAYKQSYAYKNKKLTTTTTQKPVTSEEEDKPNELNFSSGIKFDRNTTGRSFKSQSNAQDISVPVTKTFKKYNKAAEAENDTKKSQQKQAETEIDISKFLPPGFSSNATNDEKPLSVIPLKIDDISKFLPPGFKQSVETEIKKDNVTESTSTSFPTVKIADDLSKFLPPGYKPPSEEEKPKTESDDVSKIFEKIALKDISNLLPPGYNPAETTESPVATTKKSTGWYSVT